VLTAFEDWRSAIGRYGNPHHVLAREAGNNYVLQATAINALIDLHNLRCPSFNLEIARFREDARP
jgi:hypothetical protein